MPVGMATGNGIGGVRVTLVAVVLGLALGLFLAKRLFGGDD